MEAYHQLKELQTAFSKDDTVMAILNSQQLCLSSLGLDKLVPANCELEMERLSRALTVNCQFIED